MDKFLMVCYVAADFIGPDGQKFRITPDKLGIFVEAPGWIQKTLLFILLVKDGSIRVADKSEQKRMLENDPMKDVGADGKKIEEKVEEKPEEKPEEVHPEGSAVIKTRKTTTRKKKDDA